MHEQKIERLRERYGDLGEVGVLSISEDALAAVIGNILSADRVPDGYVPTLRRLRDRASAVVHFGDSLTGAKIEGLLRSNFPSVRLGRFWVVWDFAEGVDQFPAELLFSELQNLRNPGAEDIELIEPDARLIVGVSHFGEVWVYCGEA